MVGGDGVRVEAYTSDDIVDAVDAISVILCIVDIEY